MENLKELQDLKKRLNSLVKLIDKAIEDAEVNEQAEQHKAMSRYEQGMGTD